MRTNSHKARRQFVLYRPMQLGFGNDLTHIQRGGTRRPRVSVEEVRQLRPNLRNAASARPRTRPRTVHTPAEMVHRQGGGVLLKFGLTPFSKWSLDRPHLIGRRRQAKNLRQGISAGVQGPLWVAIRIC